MARVLFFKTVKFFQEVVFVLVRKSIVFNTADPDQNDLGRGNYWTHCRRGVGRRKCRGGSTEEKRRGEVKTKKAPSPG
jgi:hypothetical protein